MTDPIKLYAWPTPNGYKISLMLEECGLPYEVVPVDITKGDQHEDWFRKLNPNGKMPVITDPDGPGGEPITIFESGAILVYLAGKTGQFMPQDARGRSVVMEWLMWQMGGFGPMLGQAHHFRQYAPEKIEYGIERYTKEAQRLYGVLEKQLRNSPYMTGPEYTIADMATFPWALSHDKQGVDIAQHPQVHRWIEEIRARPATQKALDFMKEHQRDTSKGFTEEERKQLFG